MKSLSEAPASMFGENSKLDDVEVAADPLGGDPLRKRVAQQISPVLAAVADVPPGVPSHGVVFLDQCQSVPLPVGVLLKEVRVPRRVIGEVINEHALVAGPHLGCEGQSRTPAHQAGNVGGAVGHLRTTSQSELDLSGIRLIRYGIDSVTWPEAYGDPRRVHDAIGEGLSCTLIGGTAHTRWRVDVFGESDGKMARLPALTERQRVAAYGAARRGDQLLLVRASTATGVPGTWWLPGGGLLFGESPVECLVREFMEETGQRPQVRHLLDVVSDVRKRAVGGSSSPAVSWIGLEFSSPAR